MKKTQVADLLTNIKGSIVSFISILMFVALGVGMFLGISWAAPALENAADGMFDEGSFHSFQIQYPYGLSKGDLAELSHLEGVTEVEGERQSFQTILNGDRRYTVKVQSLGENIDVPIVVEGELPAHASEIALHAESARLLGVNVGDTITFEKDLEPEDYETAGVESENASGMAFLLRNTFKVTALVNNADYVSNSPWTYGYSTSPSGAVDALAWVTDDVFDASSFENGYPIVNVRCDSLDDLATFSDEYKQASNAIQEPLEALGATLAKARFDSIHGEYQKEVEDAEKQIADAEKQIADGEKEIADGETKLADARQELETARAETQAKLDSAYVTLINGEAEKAEGERKLADAYAKVDDAQRKIDEVDFAIAQIQAEVDDMKAYKNQCDEDLKSGKITQEEYNKRLDERGAQANAKIQPIAKQYAMDIPLIDHTNYEKALTLAETALKNKEKTPVVVDGEMITLGEARQRLAAAKQELAAAQAEYDSKVAELNSGWNTYYSSYATFESEVAAAEQEIADNEQKLEDAKQEVAEAKEKVAESKPAVEAAREVLDAMVSYDWMVLPRAYNSGAVEVTTFCNVTNNLSISMAALFIIVGLLVSYFAVSRIVHEQVTQIGTKKALGFRRGEITSSFLWYSGIAVVAGAIVGALLAFFLVEGIIGGVLGGMFAFGAYPAFFGWVLFLIITAVELGLVLGATYLACRKILKQHAVELLRGDQVSMGKTHFYEKWKIWAKIPLFIQVIINNCVNDKRRMLSTIVGVAGCTALIVTAITLNNDVMKSYDRQYEDVYGFNAITYAAYEPAGAIDDLDAALKAEGCTTAQVFSMDYLMEQPNGESGAMSITVPFDEDDFEELYHVIPTTADATVDLSEDGAWVTQAYAAHLGAKVGDSVIVDDENGKQHEIKILGFYEFWLTYNELVMSKESYEKEFGAVEPNMVIAQTGDIPVEDIEEKISSVEGFDSIIDDKTQQYGNFETFSTVSSAIVIIYLVLAALMAVVVLLNLNVMFIAEKKRELIVLMINGFRVKDARHYISYDSIVLTALGIIAGILLGCIMGTITVMSIEPVTGVFVRDADGWAILIGILGSTILAIIMGLISLRRIRKFDLTDINRF